MTIDSEFHLDKCRFAIILQQRKILQIMNEYNDDNPMPEEVKALAGSVKK
jgi:hypothetical protein